MDSNPFGKGNAIKRLVEEKQPENGKKPPPEEVFQEEVVDSPQRDGKNSRHQVFSVILFADDGKQYMVPYGAIVLGVGPHNGENFSFCFAAGEDLYEVRIEGPQIGYGIEMLAAGKRCTWHTRSPATTSISVEKKAPPSTP
jgi:hypothetical protein